MKNLTQAQKEDLTALYAALNFLKCNDMTCTQVEAAIAKIDKQNGGGAILKRYAPSKVFNEIWGDLAGKINKVKFRWV